MTHRARCAVRWAVRVRRGGDRRRPRCGGFLRAIGGRQRAAMRAGQRHRSSCRSASPSAMRLESARTASVDNTRPVEKLGRAKDVALSGNRGRPQPGGEEAGAVGVQPRGVGLNAPGPCPGTCDTTPKPRRECKSVGRVVFRSTDARFRLANSGNPVTHPPIASRNILWTT